MEYCPWCARNSLVIETFTAYVTSALPFIGHILFALASSIWRQGHVDAFVEHLEVKSAREILITWQFPSFLQLL